MAVAQSRLMKGYEYIAKGLEAEAAQMPPSMKKRADTFRNVAKLMRKLDNGEMVRIAKLVSSDPTSR